MERNIISACSVSYIIDKLFESDVDLNIDKQMRNTNA